jgi:hypothetical protein
MRPEQQNDVLRAIESDIPAGSRWHIMVLESPSGRAVIEWRRPARPVITGIHDDVAARGFSASPNGSDGTT